MRRVAFLLAVVPLLAACGGHGGGSSSGDPIAAAAAKTTKAGSMKADFRLAGSGIQGRGSGVFNNGKEGSGRLSMAVVAQGQTVTVETVTVGSVLFMRSPVFAQAGLPAGKEWVRLDLGQIAKRSGIDLGSLLNSNPNPGGALAYLRGSTGNVQKLGSEQVRGVQTTHYKATIDLERAARKASGSARDTIRRVIGLSGRKVLAVEVWVDGDEYVRKVVYSQVASKQQSTQITMELHDFGPRVQIASPPKDSVIDFLDILSQRR
jgi:hypothetical protein